MTITPASQPTTAPVLGDWQPLPNAGATPHTPADDTLAPPSRTQKILISIVVVAVLVIATLGFIGSYAAVTKLARAKGFGDFSEAFPIAVDAGIIAFLALDLLLTWRRIGFPLLRYTAWGLTTATIAFNAAAAWPDPLGVGMHSVIPVLFVIAVEAARHAIGRIADITADKHIEGVPLVRWLVAPTGSFRIWRRMRLWNIRSYARVLELEREARIYRAQLHRQHGRRWRSKAGADQLLVLRLAKDGMSIQDAIELPKREAQKQAEAEAKLEAEARARAEAEAEVKHQAELRAAEVEAKRRAEIAEAEAAEAEAKRRAEVAAEAARLEVEAKRRAEAEAARLLVAETEAKLADLARAKELADVEANLKRRQQAAAAARLEQEQQAIAADARAAAARREREQAAHAKAQRIASEGLTRNAATSTSASGSGSASGPAAGTTSTSGSASGPRSIGPQRGKRQAEVETVLARIAETGDPKSVTLEWVMDHFDLKQTTAYDRLATAQKLWAEAQTKTA